ncbi:MAG: dihydropyrimidinase [Anaerolineaceae bacterium]|jgi:dihydropyrimidinase|nr:dihydropyrimidinase [Anaerolineaceae bacterium]MDD4042295.1 dihydropyrimidinase [Anaerolineaceae bacterium]MDD4578625.1 dihydropyrimidinase [Anaerolineaceae bacterium]
MQTLIIDGTIVTAEGRYKSNILIEDGIITRIGDSTEMDEGWVIDAEDQLVLPGGVDPHVHLNLEMAGTVSSDDYYTGGKAAAFGGTTTVIDFVSQGPGSLEESVSAHRRFADSNTSIDYSSHMNITYFDDQVAEQIAGLPDLGITSIKVFTAYNDRLRINDGDVFRAMRVAGQNDILTMVHAENGDVIDLLIKEALQAGHTEPIWHALTRPGWGAVEASLRAFALAAQADAPVYLVHMNMAGEVDQLKYARSQGIYAMGETCPQYLFFNEENLLQTDGAKFVCSPPLRSKTDNAALWQGLEDGTIQVLATDHCPFFFNGQQAIEYEGEMVAIPGKELGKSDFTKIPNGLPGLGDRLPLLWTYGVLPGRISPERFVALTSTNPAKIFGLYPKKGTIQVGSDGDIAIWDPKLEIKYGVNVAQHRTDYNLYEGWKLKGMPTMVLQHGEILVENGAWYGKPGQGKFIERVSGEVL